MVAIKDFEMPKNCEDCSFFRGGNSHCDLGCFIPYDYDYYTETYKNENCPLVEAIPIPKDATNEDILKAVFPKDAEDIIKYIKTAILNGWLNSKYEGLEDGKID